MKVSVEKICSLLTVMMLVVCSVMPAYAKKEKGNKNEVPIEKMSMKELIDKIKSIEFTKPSRTGKEIDRMYDHVEELYKLLTGIDEKVPIYEIKRVVVKETGDTILAPVDTEGRLRGSKESLDQTVTASAYVTELVTTAALVAVEYAANSVQIGADALEQKTPMFLGGPSKESTERFVANKQAWFFTKAFHPIQMALKNQARLMTHYRRLTEEQGAAAGPIKSMPGEDLSTEQILTMSSDDVNAWFEKEKENMGS